MKEYKYKINGNLYKVAVGDIDNNVAQVEVNGTPYTVELEKKEVVNVVNKPRPSAAPRTETGAKVIAKPTAAASAPTGNPNRSTFAGSYQSVWAFAPRPRRRCDGPHSASCAVRQQGHRVRV